MWTIDYSYMIYGAELLSGQEESRDKNYCYALQTLIRIIGFSNMTDLLLLLLGLCIKLATQQLLINIYKFD